MTVVFERIKRSRKAGGPEIDMTLLQVEVPESPVDMISDGRGVLVGQCALPVGRTRGLQNLVFAGIVSGRWVAL